MNLIVSAISAIAWLVIEMMVLINPSHTLIMKISGVGEGFFLILSLPVAFLLPFLTLKAEDSHVFFIRFFGSMTLLILMAWCAGFFYHRDFYTYAFQAVMLFLVVFLVRMKDLGIVRRRREVYRIFSTATVIIFILWTIWLMMMAFAIVTRVEPRWIEATAYNIVNGVIGLLLLFAAGIVHEQSRRTIYIIEGEVFLDERNITASLSPQENLIVCTFLSAPGHSLTCSSLRRKLKPPEEYDEMDELSDCRFCLEKKWTASKCAIYRNIKNRINDTKKYLELLQIGTIVPVSEKTRDIKELGWVLRLFDDVEVGATRRWRLEHFLRTCVQKQSRRFRNSRTASGG